MDIASTRRLRYMVVRHFISRSDTGIKTRQTYPSAPPVGPRKYTADVRVRVRYERRGGEDEIVSMMGCYLFTMRWLTPPAHPILCITRILWLRARLSPHRVISPHSSQSNSLPFENRILARCTSISNRSFFVVVVVFTKYA